MRYPRRQTREHIRPLCQAQQFCPRHRTGIIHLPDVGTAHGRQYRTDFQARRRLYLLVHPPLCAGKPHPAGRKQDRTYKSKKQKITVLVAEDHDSNFRLIESILRKDYNLIHAWNGQEAVNMFREYDPQLILMDINMPVMNGYEATREIRKYSTQVPIIAVTAFAYASDEQQVMENGFDAYMAKPINANQLRTQISAILKQHIIFM